MARNKAAFSILFVLLMTASCKQRSFNNVKSMSEPTASLFANPCTIKELVAKAPLLEPKIGRHANTLQPLSALACSFLAAHQKFFAKSHEIVNLLDGNIVVKSADVRRLAFSFDLYTKTEGFRSGHRMVFEANARGDVILSLRSKYLKEFLKTKGWSINEYDITFSRTEEFAKLLADVRDQFKLGNSKTYYDAYANPTKALFLENGKVVLRDRKSAGSGQMIFSSREWSIFSVAKNSKLDWNDSKKELRAELEFEAGAKLSIVTIPNFQMTGSEEFKVYFHSPKISSFFLDESECGKTLRESGRNGCFLSGNPESMTRPLTEGFIPEPQDMVAI
jgi:hypothetical protein